MILWSYAEQVGSECPSCLETKVHVGRVHEGSTTETDKKGTNGEDSPALLWKIVEWLERVKGEVVVVFDIERLDALDVEVLLVQSGVCVCGCVERVLLLCVRRPTVVSCSTWWQAELGNAYTMGFTWPMG
jgi:hypothetical protein